MVFGNQWEPAISVVQVCSAIGFISCIGALQMSLIKGLGHTSWILKYQIAQQVSTAILVLIFAKDGAYIVMLAIAIKLFYLAFFYALCIKNIGSRYSRLYEELC